LPKTWEELEMLKKYERKCPAFGSYFACNQPQWEDCKEEIREACKKKFYEYLSATIKAGSGGRFKTRRRRVSREEFQKLSKEKPEDGKTKKESKKKKHTKTRKPTS